MKVLYIGYWSVKDGLTSATIIPAITTLIGLPTVDEVIFCSMERNGTVPILRMPGVVHVPLYSRDYMLFILTKVMEYRSFVKQLTRICQTERVDMIICRSSLAGSFGDRLSSSLGIPYLVESFEPHRDYMIESKVWRRRGLRAWVQGRAEALQKKNARCLITVSHNYASRLLQEGVDAARILTAPCFVDLLKFGFSEKTRIETRARLKIPSGAIVGIYVGKFGGIYYGEEAFSLYRKAFDFFGEDFCLIILTQHDTAYAMAQIERFELPLARVIVDTADHDEVNDYLCAADFAFCTIRPTPARAFCSPVKNGEYWACGLPVLIEPGIGDDSMIVTNEGGGVLLENDDFAKAFRQLQSLFSMGRLALSKQIREIAVRHRNSKALTTLYQRILSVLPNR